MCKRYVSYLKQKRKTVVWVNVCTDKLFLNKLLCNQFMLINNYVGNLNFQKKKMLIPSVFWMRQSGVIILTRKCFKTRSSKRLWHISVSQRNERQKRNSSETRRSLCKISAFARWRSSKLSSKHVAFSTLQQTHESNLQNYPIKGSPNVYIYKCTHTYNKIQYYPQAVDNILAGSSVRNITRGIRVYSLPSSSSSSSSSKRDVQHPRET